MWPLRVQAVSEAVNFSVSMEQNPSFRYVQQAVELWDWFWCRFICLIIVLPISMVLYRNVIFFASKPKHPDCFVSWVLLTPGLWNKIWLCGNTIDADGISLETAAFLHCALPQAFLMKQSFYFTGIVPATLRRGR